MATQRGQYDDRYVATDGHYPNASGGRNVAQIISHGTRVIQGRIPARVRKELMDAVKVGDLGRLPKDGLRPEVFFHPACKVSASEIRDRHAAYSVSLIAKVLA